MDEFERAMKIAYGFFIVIMILILLSMVFVMLAASRINEECTLTDISKLRAWNGITDKNTGLFSGGSVKRDTFLFENGMVIDSKVKNIQIGKEYYIYSCKSFMNSEDLEVRSKINKWEKQEQQDHQDY